MAECEEMTEMATSSWLRMSLFGNLFIAIISFPVLLIALRYINSQQLFHTNTRIQIKVHIFALLVHSAGRFSLHSLDLINYFTNSDCNAFPNFYRCFVVRGLYNFGLALAAMCTTSLAIERSVALHYNSTYEKCGKGFGVLLGFLQLALAFAFLYKLYFDASFTPVPSVTLYYCQTLASGHGSVWTINAPLYVVMVAQCVCRCVFWYIEVQTKKRRSAQPLQTLSTRYTLEQGIRSIKALNMFINANCFVFFFLSFIGTTLHFNAANIPRPTYFALVEVIHFVPTYGILLSVYTYYSLRKLNNNQKHSLTKSIHVDSSRYLIEFKKQIG